MTRWFSRADFKARLWLIVLVGLAWRVAYVLVTKRHTPVWGDPFAYHYGANLLAQGKGFIDPLRYEVFGQTYPSAYHPPLYLVYLAAWSLVGVKSVLGHRLVSCLLGSATVGLVGLLGRRLAGDRVGLIAALLAAAYPQLWLNDAGLLSETAAAFGVVLSLLALYRFRDRPTACRAFLLGGALALTALSRVELLILVPLLALPVVIFVKGLSTRERWLRLGAVAAAVIVLMGPWVGYNLGRFHKPVYLSDGLGAVLFGGACDAVFYGSMIGYWTDCPQTSATGAKPIPTPPASTIRRWEADPAGTLAERRAFFASSVGNQPDESVNDTVAQNEALTYIRAHEKQLPLVLAARVGRIWGVFRPIQTARFDGTIEGRGLAQARVALVSYYLYAAAGMLGLVALRRRKQLIWPYIVLAGVVTFSVMVAYGIQRYRMEFDVALPALAAVGIDAFLRRRARGRASATRS